MITHDITHKRGDTLKTILFTSTSATINFAGATVRAHIRKYSADPMALAELDVAVTTGGSVGAYTIQIAVSLPAAETALLPIGKLNYDVELTYGSGIVETVAGGRFTVVEDYTR